MTPRLACNKGLFLGFTDGCGSISLPGGGTYNASDICGQAIGTVENQIVAAQHAFQAATIAAGPAANGSYIGTPGPTTTFTGTNLFAPNFRTPYSIQLNGGIQHEFRPGTVLSVDYLRNRAPLSRLL